MHIEREVKKNLPLQLSICGLCCLEALCIPGISTAQCMHHGHVIPHALKVQLQIFPHHSLLL